MRLLIAEKPDVARRLHSLKLIPSDTEIVFTYGFGLWRDALPSLSLQSIPFTEYPDKLRPSPFKFKKLLLDVAGEVLFKADEHCDDREYIGILNEMVSYLSQKMPEYEEIICAVDPDRAGYGSAKQLLDLIGGGNSVPVHCLYLNYLDDNHVLYQWQSRFDQPWSIDSKANRWATEQRVKKTFDYWWNANSSVVLSELCKWCNLKADPLISKYELMLMCLMANQNRPLNDWEIIDLMVRWAGSGKYSDKNNLGFGTVASRGAILQSAINRDILIPSMDPDKSGYVLSEVGKAFIDRLHPRTFDPDLAFRLESWIQSEDYDSMRRYINTVFGRQLRYQRNYFRVSMTQIIINEIYCQKKVICRLIPDNKTLPCDNVQDNIELKSEQGKFLGQISVRAYSGPYGVSYKDSEGIYLENCVYAKGDEEFAEYGSGTFSPEQWISKLNIK